MLKKTWIRGLVVGLAVVLLIGGTAGVVSAYGGPGDGWFGFGRREDYDALLAEELDVTVEELQAAREAAHEQVLEQALEDGVITEEQYENAQMRMALRPYLDPQALMAEALGVSEDELAEKTLAEWMEELELDRETLIDRLEDAYEAALDQAVADGIITEDEVDDLEDRFFGLRLRGRGVPFQREPGMHGFPRRGHGLDENAPLDDSGFAPRGFMPGF
ncbi:MAG: hypothetical protein ACP5HM_01590 [Anaerolineae bacterium]